MSTTSTIVLEPPLTAATKGGLATPGTATYPPTPSPAPSIAPSAQPLTDIEHIPVHDDPRRWSAAWKWTTLAILSWAAAMPAMAANIWFPALSQIQDDLKTSEALISATVSLYILVQGSMPLLWSPISDLYGRKVCFLSGMTMYTIASAIAAATPTMAGLMAARLIQAAGSSTVLSIAAGSLAEIFDPQERGSKLGIYYAAPILGPAIAPIIGGLLTEASSWRTSFWFVAGCGASNVVSFVFYKDTYRRERSAVWQVALARQATESLPAAGRLDHTYQPPRSRKLSPLASAGRVLSKPHNLIILTLSGLVFASNYTLNFAATRTFSAAPYNLSPIQVGAILLTMGMGGVVGSLVGGWYSDRCVRSTFSEETGIDPEQRLRSIRVPLAICPISMVAFAWVTSQQLHISISCVALFVVGLAQNWAYSASLSYILDTNPGRTTGTVACNSLFRGLMACIGSAVTSPLQQSIGIGAMFTGWAVLVTVATAFAMMLMKRGKQWRDKEWKKPARRS
ncbi:uncharacterized protein PSFLO_00046 [Pseudozyma flocculosa]|uniref:Major facilitator superfamily (MFS) profile domain-containing protein n=1 Tax=Pseudozyma flocculosa TaxID=84751 RepID=A0A5C3ES94_9BASI|nr:uncharacterized protein PSFLO_00046 [Pseudozyma flocculosa]